MLYAVTYEIVGIMGPGGALDTSHERIVDFATGVAEVALDHLGDSANFVEWADLSDEVLKPAALLSSDDPVELIHEINQISDELKSQREGYIGFWEYQDIFELIREHDVESWCTQPLKRRIADIRRSYHRLISDLSDEWTGFFI